MKSLSRSFAWPRWIACAAALLAIGAGAQGPSASRPNQANWPLANRFTAESLRPFVYSSSLTPGWINRTDTFWYSWRDDKGIKFWKVDPKAKKKAPLFDEVKMAALLSEVTRRPYDTTNLPITTVTFDERNPALIRFQIQQERFEYDSEKDTLRLMPAPTRGGGQGPRTGPGQGQGQGRGQGQGPGQAPTNFRNTSPDGKAFVYAMDHNLYYVAIVDGKEQDPIQLTKDGEKDFSFGSRDTTQQFRQQQQQQQQQDQLQDQIQEQQDQQQETQTGTTQERRVRANVTWSKDSKRFYVTRSDSRKVKELFLVNSLSQPRPTLLTYKYAMPGEPDVPQTHLYAFDPDKKELKTLPIDKYRDQRLLNIHWQDTTSDALRFVRRDRLQRNMELCEIDLTSDKVKVLLTESVENAFLEIQPVRYVEPGGDFLWFSERTGWGHYYLYENDGKLKHAVTSGPYRAFQILDVDAKKQIMWFRGVGREPEENPYYRHLYCVNLDGKNLRLLDPGDADHNSTLSPSKDFIVDVCSRTDMAPKALVRDSKGNVILELEEMDLTRLQEVGWRMPERFLVKAADGVTDIHGNMWKPTDFDARKKYPIIAHVYPGPQTESVTATFAATATNQRLAQLGFIVIQIGNRGGNPARSNAYHSYGYFNLRDYGLADKKAGIEQLAARHPWIDVDKVGIYGHSGGGFMTAAALLLPPYNTFFKVGVSSAGNHDNNIYNANWSEQHHGLKEAPVKDKDGKDTREMKFEIKVPTNAELAANLKGKLLLVHGDMDNNVHPGGTIRLVDALIKANKRFDFLLFPGKAHGFGDMQPYFTQMMMEYFAEHLLGDYYRGDADIKVGQ